MDSTIDEEMVARLAALLDTPDDYEDWLAAKPPMEIVGVTGQACACPLHTWLEQRGFPGMHVRRGVFYTPDGHDISMQRWALRFTRDVDELPFRQGNLRFAPRGPGDAEYRDTLAYRVTAAQARWLMQEIRRDLLLPIQP